jgi:hypothetical protein
MKKLKMIRKRKSKKLIKVIQNKKRRKLNKSLILFQIQLITPRRNLEITLMDSSLIVLEEIKTVELDNQLVEMIRNQQTSISM